MKKKIYIILCVLTAVFVMSTAAVCNLCSLADEKIGNLSLNIDDGQTEGSQDNSGNNESGDNSNAGSKDDKNGSSSSDGTDNDGSQSQGNDNNSNSSSKSGKNPPEINSISVNSDTFSPGMTYKFTSDVTDPDNDKISYDWHIDAGYVDTPESSSVNWTLPNDDGLYSIILTVSDGWGGYDSMTRDIFVGKAAVNPTTFIDDIAVYPEGGIYTGNTYEIWCYITDTVGISDVAFSVNGGVLHSQDANVIKWDAPDAPGTYTVDVTVTDKAGQIVKSSENFVVEQTRVEISDLIVKIDYISAGTSYYLSAVIIDPENQISRYEWSCSGGGIRDQTGYLAVWETPNTPGIYSLTLKAFTLKGDTLVRTEEFEVKTPK